MSTEKNQASEHSLNTKKIMSITTIIQNHSPDSPPEQIPYKSRKEWLKLRQSGIGGSDITAIMGINPYKTPLDIRAEKLGHIPPETEPMQIGRDMEHTIVRMFKKRFREYHIDKPRVLFRRGSIFLATPDRFATTPEGQTLILEVKNTGYLSKTLKTLAAYQLQWYCYVCNSKGGYLVVLERGTKLHTIPIFRDDALIDTMLKTAERWWLENIIKQE